ncbi:hypothetical protein ATANTOWER_013439 [Ataeniobius toweri]|uniref:Uncharacterized protein n=1 Tax=Ataeniobius toweri TaxID=208326 RepID=A0ABU7B058_9TELE|nr:hypothetical protein [Ataeniobius toweri]
MSHGQVPLIRFQTEESRVVQELSSTHRELQNDLEIGGTVFLLKATSNALNHMDSIDTVCKISGERRLFVCAIHATPVCRRHLVPITVSYKAPLVKKNAVESCLK